MEFNDSPEEAAWRKEVHDFLDKEFPPEFRGRAPRRGPGGGGGGEGGGSSAEGEGLFRGPDEGAAQLQLTLGVELRRISEQKVDGHDGCLGFCESFDEPREMPVPDL